ncbi:MAG: hypothetical protein IPP63_17250 [Chloracidobacterium sp.]|nr:hypothetical protein [Chloracidobacterium sp.]
MRTVWPPLFVVPSVTSSRFANDRKFGRGTLDIRGNNGKSVHLGTVERRQIGVCHDIVG